MGRALTYTCLACLTLNCALASRMNLASRVAADAKVVNAHQSRSESIRERLQRGRTGRALIIVDVQDCFLEGGSLAVNGASRVVPVINKLLEEKECLFDLVIKSQDYHPAGHISFGASNGLPNIGVGTPIPMRCTKPASGKLSEAACCPDVDAAPENLKANISQARASMGGNVACTKCFDGSSTCFEQQQAMWPVHCLDSGDSNFPTGDRQIIEKPSHVVVQKGSNMYVDAYSAFMDNTKSLKTELDNLLQLADIKEIFVVGIATDFCVAWTAEDGHNLGYKVSLIEDASAGIGIPLPEGGDTITSAISGLKSKGVDIIKASDLDNCPAVADTTDKFNGIL